MIEHISERWWLHLPQGKNDNAMILINRKHASPCDEPKCLVVIPESTLREKIEQLRARAKTTSSVSYRNERIAMANELESLIPPESSEVIK